MWASVPEHRGLKSWGCTAGVKMQTPCPASEIELTGSDGT
jgi:hypothetical protein